ncbi:unnamed protein product [Rhizophagus irregularis]|uniref:Uncharacterized protein n=1 Tax=Rhizophagus irregularis TaxID=588596 RepID=A0A2N1NPX8_9GLOM|nr:hypothetical protein RhiirC2_773019 [Rhizophagus irregularis]CAB4383754.1 unnamed protein product [Rhizophagus irregularis]CAB5353454.1 unnamed protein product [Rhizophagus irregularis]
MLNKSLPVLTKYRWKLPNKLSDKWDNLQDKLSNKWDNLQNKFSDKWDELQETINYYLQTTIPDETHTFSTTLQFPDVPDEMKPIF